MITHGQMIMRCTGFIIMWHLNSTPYSSLSTVEDGA
jgi:hypothetical protein